MFCWADECVPPSLQIAWGRVNTRPFVVYSVLVCLAGCRAAEQTAVLREPSVEWFVDRTEETGLTFTHFNGMSGDFYYPEVMPPGVALLDFDNDGDLDVFVIQGGMFSGKLIDSALSPPKSPLSRATSCGYSALSSGRVVGATMRQRGTAFVWLAVV